MNKKLFGGKHVEEQRDLEVIRRNLAVLDKIKKERDQWRECARGLAYWLAFEGSVSAGGMLNVSRNALAKFDALEKGMK